MRAQEPPPSTAAQLSTTRHTPRTTDPGPGGSSVLGPLEPSPSAEPWAPAPCHRPRTLETAAGPTASQGWAGSWGRPVRRRSGLLAPGLGDRARLLWDPREEKHRAEGPHSPCGAPGMQAQSRLRTPVVDAGVVRPAPPGAGCLARPPVSTLTRCCLPTGRRAATCRGARKECYSEAGKRELLVRAQRATDTDALLASLPPRPPLAVPPHGEPRDLASGPQTRAAAVAPLGRWADEAD